MYSSKKGYILEILEIEQDNIRAAIDWAIQNEPLKALQIVYEYSKFWEIRGYLDEAFITKKSLI